MPNDRLRAHRLDRGWSLDDLADQLVQIGTREGEHALGLTGNTVGRWERGGIRPRSPYPRLLCLLFGVGAADLGLTDSPLNAEAELFDTMELAQMAEASDIGSGALEALEEAADLLCRAYPSAPALELRKRTKQRLAYVLRLLDGRLTLSQHRELLATAGWLSLLLGCLHYDLGEREHAEAARQAAYQMGKATSHNQLMAWAFEMAAWFALVEGRYRDVIQFAQSGQREAGVSNAMVQLVLQEARGHARLKDRRATTGALGRGAKLLEQLPVPDHPEHHFVFDHTKWVFYAATCYCWLGEDEPAEEHARQIINHHTRPDGTSDAPMRTAISHLDLAVTLARRRNLAEAVHHGITAFNFRRKTQPSLLDRAGDLDQLLAQEYPREQLSKEFHERYILERGNP